MKVESCIGLIEGAKNNIVLLSVEGLLLSSNILWD